jgi:hypothetical protein
MYIGFINFVAASVHFMNGRIKKTVFHMIFMSQENLSPLIKLQLGMHVLSGHK